MPNSKIDRPNSKIDRRRVLAGGTGFGILALGGCGRAPDAESAGGVLQYAEDLTYRVQRWLLGADRLAPEYSEADITQAFRPNGTTSPSDGDYTAHANANFENWRLVVDGLVERPASLAVAELRSMPSRTQITRHDCVEGWSCIGKWKGTPLALLLDRVGVKPKAKYAVFHCADIMEGGEDDSEDPPEGADGPKTASPPATSKSLSEPIRYYETIDLVDARHPQTIIAYDLNGEPIPIANGAPLRLRVERQLGYKMAKYVNRIELVESFAELGDGRGGYWEDRGYDWYAGI